MKGKVENLFITQPFEKDPIKVDKLEVFLAGIKQDRHYGSSKISGVREAPIVTRGIEITNLRTVTLVSTEELSSVSKNLEITEVTAFDIEANIEISGIPNFTQLPVGTMLKFPRQCVLFITSENFPCVVAGGRVARRVKDKDITWKFPKAALHLRGLTAMTFASGIIKVGDEVEIISVNSFK